ncbi:hypothetical protein ACFL08_04705 [Patescibacteria group bacterium]
MRIITVIWLLINFGLGMSSGESNESNFYFFLSIGFLVIYGWFLQRVVQIRRYFSLKEKAFLGGSWITFFEIVVAWIVFESGVRCQAGEYGYYIAPMIIVFLVLWSKPIIQTYLKKFHEKPEVFVTSGRSETQICINNCWHDVE